VRSGELDRAETTAGYAARMLGDDGRVTGVLADLARARGDDAEAERLLRVLLEAAPDSRYIRRRLERPR